MEEGLKFLIVTSVIAKFKDYDDAVDGIVYCVCLSQGFAALENIYYVFSLYGASYEIALLRAFSAVPAHAMFGAILEFFIHLIFWQKERETKRCF